MNYSVDAGRIRFVLAGFRDWWLQELHEIATGLTGFKRGEPGLFLVDEAGQVQLDRSDMPDKLHQHRIKLQLPTGTLMHRVIRLPIAAAGELEQVLQYEFDKYFPLAWQDVYAAVQTEQQEDDNHLNVHIRAVRKTLIDDVVSRIEQEHGIITTEIDLLLAQEQAQVQDGVVSLTNYTRHNVVQQKSAGQDSSLRDNSLLFPLLLLMLIVAAALIPFYKMDSYLTELEQQTRHLEEQAKDAIVVRNKMLAVEQNLQQVVSAKKASPQFTRIWSAVTDVMAAKGVLASIRVTDKKVIIEGKATSVEKVVRALEAHAYFHKVSIDAPVKRLEQGKYESLRLSFMVKHDD